MDRIDHSLEHLIDEIKNSNEYIMYQELKAKIKEEPEKEQAIHRFREQNYLLQKSKDVDLFDEIDQIWREYESLRMQPLVEEFLAAELALCRTIQKINLKMVSSLDFDMGFLDE